MQAMQRLQQLGLVCHFDNHGGRSEHFFLQHLGAVDQQAGIGLEQLRAGLIAVLPGACEMTDASHFCQALDAFAVAVQTACIE